MATLDARSSVETLLGAIHLERYVSSFRGVGLLLAQDLVHLDHQTLLDLGVTATGHRKRILRLVTHITQELQPAAAASSFSSSRHRNRCQSVTVPAVSAGLETLRNQSAPDLCAMLTSDSKVTEKPVPRPRTVFQRRRTAPLQAPPPPERLYQEGPPTSRRFSQEAPPLPRRLSQEEALPTTPLLPGGSLAVPPVPPRMSHGPTLTSSPPLAPTDFAVAEEGVHMVSNDLYWGASAGARGYCSQQLAPPTPPRQLDRKPERNSNLSSFSSESTRASTDDPEEEISPYCETIFHSSRSPAPLPAEQQKREEGHGAEEHGKRHSRDSQGYSLLGADAAASRPPLEAEEELTISPYACYDATLGDTAPPIISGWLDKLSPQGTPRSTLTPLLSLFLSASLCISCSASFLRSCFVSFFSPFSSSSTRNYVFQKRFVKFDGKNLMYFGSEKDAYPKGVIPLAAIQMARPAKDNKFEVVTSQRIFVFRTDEVLRRRWLVTLQQHVQDQLAFGRRRFGPGRHCQKHGVLELKGVKSKVYAAINTEQIWIYKNQQCFKNGIGITLIEARGSTIRDSKHKMFDLITPYKTFSFTAESEREKREWMEALQEAIAETLSDYEVAEKVWSNRSNRTCADCKAPNPDWASINLCVVICKNCAGQHRGLGTMVSKVQSLKLDTSVWSNEIVQLFIMLGNDRANEFWAARLCPSEELDSDASPEQRRDFITQKYRVGRYRVQHPSISSQEELLKVLCTAVSDQTLLKTVTRIFSEAESARVTERHNGCEGHHHHPLDHCSTADPGVYDEIMQPVLHSGFLYKTAAHHRGTLSRKTREDFQRFWCSVDRSLLLYESEGSTEPVLQINAQDLVCVGVSRPDGTTNSSSNNNGFIHRFRYTFDLYLCSEKLHHFGVETADALHSWTRSIGKAMTPLSCHCLLTREFERVGLLRYRAMLDPGHWKEAFFVLQRSNLFICPRTEGAAEDIINLNRLQELSVTSEMENHEKKDILVLVEKGRTLHLQGLARSDFVLWYRDIQRAAGGRGNTLREQQLSRNDIPIIVDSCLAFITQYGLGHEGVYRKNGAKSRIKVLMDEFRKDARNVKLRIGEHFIEDVTDVLKRFFRELEDPVFMAELHPQWQGAAKSPVRSQRLDRYKEIIRSLPRVNRTTLAALISHLYRVQKCADLNQMCTKNLALLFAPSLFQTDGKGEHEVKIMEDLIDHYLYVFEIDEEHQSQLELEINLITSWKDTQLSQAGDLIMEVYLEMKIPDCCITLKVSPTMCAEELTNQVLFMRNVPAGERDIWMTFEAVEDGELERPLHPKEKVLEQALQWCHLREPSSAYLLVKKVPRGEGLSILTSYQSDIIKVGLLRCREEPPKLLQGTRFQERTFQIKDRKLLLLKEKKSIKPEKEWPLKTMKIYIGIRRKLKAPNRWGFTAMSDKHQLFLCCSSEADLWDWIACLLCAQNRDPAPPVLRRHLSSDISKQKFGTMPLVPIRGDESNSSMLSANQTLRKLHDRRTLSMYFPMKAAQDSVEERCDSPELPEPLYEEVGDFGLQVLRSLRTSFLSQEVNELPGVNHLHQQHRLLPVGGGQGGEEVEGKCSKRCEGGDEVEEEEEEEEEVGEAEGEEESSWQPEGRSQRRRRRRRRKRRQPPGVCTPSQELLLQELSSAFTKRTEEEQEEEKLEEEQQEQPNGV